MSFTEGAGEGITQKRNFPGEAEAGDGNVSITRPSVNESGDAPVKRKRGRPPKYKPQAPEGQNITITPKQLSPPAKGRRGRPPKKQIVHEEDQANSGHGDQEKEEVVQRRRGSSPASEDVKEIPDENELSDAHGDGLLVKVRISRRLAKKRESGYVVPWKALMKAVKDESDDSDDEEEEESAEEPPSSESPFIIKNKANKVGRPRGRPPKQGRNEESEKGGQVLNEIKSLQVAITKQDITLTDVTEKKEDLQIFDHAAAKIVGQLPGKPEQIKATMDGIAQEAQLRGFQIKDDAIYVFGSLDALIKAKQLITEALESMSPVASDTENTDVDSTPLNIQTPNVDKQEEKNGKEGEEEGETAEITTEDNTLINPTTGKRYNRLCAVYKNPENANVVCELCNFVSTERGMLKHKVRKHPNTVFECEICLHKFGVRYDMRRHRISHFDSMGILKPCFEPYFRKRFPDISGPITLSLLEQDFSPPDIDTGEPGEEGTGRGAAEGRGDGEASVKTDKQGETSEESKETATSRKELPDQQEMCDEEEEVEEKVGPGVDVKHEDIEDSKEHSEKMEESEEDELRLTPSQLKQLSLLHMCQHCDFSGYRSNVERHRLQSHPQFLYKCPDCPVEIGDFSEMVKHYAQHHNVSPSYVDKKALRHRVLLVCCDCGLEDRENGMKSHIERLHEVTYRCRHCNKECLDETSLQAHFRVMHKKIFKIPSKCNKQTTNPKHAATSAAKYGTKFKPKQALKLPPDVGRQPCEVCGTSVRLAWYHQHMKTHKRETLSCDKCSYKTELRFQLKNHKLTKHGPKQFMCDICGQTFAFKQTQKAHMKAKHSETPETFPCEFCEKTFTVRRFLTTHVKRMHFKEKKYYCDVCNRGFFEKIRMKQHREVHLPQQDKDALKKFNCSYCTMKFRDASRLAQHENIHTGNKPFKCKQCDKAFKWSSELSKHMTLHHNEDRRFQCGTCFKSFKFRYKLNSHMIIHTQERKHFCGVCSKVFTSMATLKKHRCRLLALTETQSSEGQEMYVQVAEGMNPETIQINMETPETAVMSSEELANFQAAGGATDGSVTFMCGICHRFFSTADKINQHVLQAHEDSNTVTGEEDNNNGLPEETVEVTEQHLVDEEGTSLVIEEVEDQTDSSYVDSIAKDASHGADREVITQGSDMDGDKAEGEETTMTVQVIDLNGQGESIQVIHIEDSDMALDGVIADEDGNSLSNQVIIDGQFHQIIHRQVEDEIVQGPEMQIQAMRYEDGQMLEIGNKEEIKDLVVQDEQILLEVHSEANNEENNVELSSDQADANFGHVHPDNTVSQQAENTGQIHSQQFIGQLVGGDNMQVIQVIQEPMEVGTEEGQEVTIKVKSPKVGSEEEDVMEEQILIVQGSPETDSQLVDYSPVGS